jgi:hypothetical protein
MLSVYIVYVYLKKATFPIKLHFNQVYYKALKVQESAQLLPNYGCNFNM